MARLRIFQPQHPCKLDVVLLLHAFVGLVDVAVKVTKNPAGAEGGADPGTGNASGEGKPVAFPHPGDALVGLARGYLVAALTAFMELPCPDKPLAVALGRLSVVAGAVTIQVIHFASLPRCRFRSRCNHQETIENTQFRFVAPNIKLLIRPDHIVDEKFFRGATGTANVL